MTVSAAQVNEGAVELLPSLSEGHSKLSHSVPQGIRVHPQELPCAAGAMDLPLGTVQSPPDVLRDDAIQGGADDLANVSKRG